MVPLTSNKKNSRFTHCINFVYLYLHAFFTGLSPSLATFSKIVLYLKIASLLLVSLIEDFNNTRYPKGYVFLYPFHVNNSKLAFSAFIHHYLRNLG